MGLHLKQVHTHFAPGQRGDSVSSRCALHLLPTLSMQNGEHDKGQDLKGHDLLKLLFLWLCQVFLNKTGLKNQECVAVNNT